MIGRAPTTADHIDLKDPETQQIKRAFDLFDQDGSGQIEKDEILERLHELGFRDAKSLGALDKVLSTVDKGGDNNISWEEFYSVMSDKLGPDSSDSEISKVWMEFGGADGRITLNELKKAAKTLGDTVTEDELKEMIKMFASKDGNFIKYEDFTKIMKKPLTETDTS
ncbi:unnamed protein product [Vitrella brassicaformis CCMP3155]|uniref:EF-hand domain-containing protein n=1 Tax=Vitrella brassicaformis (strain CCMP3155) TaxID=1169540 RepID=A0A0G4GPH4_VITBC|nr:unnamed protein product [Vitrella brassicaformis CCMP3155]|mmetsp:Transcript_34432/g.85336  ORF Transcript_34432/g.85336 Transcript_34432/m.85336 type:complete len:167 (-) Transcript_34432:279-779(-)|eukprot:CEM32253.1 unnamed protein product [Vitrella brassicaformis CCMP3155]